MIPLSFLNSFGLSVSHIALMQLLSWDNSQPAQLSWDNSQPAELYSTK